MESVPDSPTMYRVAAIIVTYNSAEHIERCLLRLREASHSMQLYTIVVDNASTDATVGIAGRVDGDVEIVRNSENVGYAKGNNLAIELLRGSGFSHYLIVNPDIEVTPGFLDVLMQTMAEDEGIGMISPTVFCETRTSRHSETEGMRSLWGIKPCCWQPEENLWFVDRLPGSCMLIRSEVFEQVGLFDESYFLYWEEIDLCLRARRAGFRLAVCRAVEVSHYSGAQSEDKGERTYRVYYMWRNQFRFAFKNWNAWVGSLFVARRLGTMFREAAQYLRAGHIPLLKALGYGFLAGIRGETGRSSHPLADPDTGRSCLLQ